MKDYKISPHTLIEMSSKKWPQLADFAIFFKKIICNFLTGNYWEKIPL